ncbi:hypothetical protein EA472_12300 [Natrarchaeobius oligotrophus]|uniref:Uncharacterized protein n=1 Tax=Natrarchaeobius chitinivorans TaxID=1679083 RepID=A0A3N6MY51_NATCH|nr:hypothetical protein EA472_12300 [Natrarchaeobius chitinivorans]
MCTAVRTTATAVHTAATTVHTAATTVRTAVTAVVRPELSRLSGAVSIVRRCIGSPRVDDAFPVRVAPRLDTGLTRVASRRVSGTELRVRVGATAALGDRSTPFLH